MEGTNINRAIELVAIAMRVLHAASNDLGEDEVRCWSDEDGWTVDVLSDGEFVEVNVYVCNNGRSRAWYVPEADVAMFESELLAFIREARDE